MASKFAPFRHWWLVFTAETKRLAAYRAQFWFELILSSIIELLVALTVWRAVFESTGKSVLSGYDYPMMALYLTVAIFFSQAAKGTGVGTFQREVYEGTLTKFLVYPLSIYSYKLGTYLPRGLFALGQMLVALTIIYTFGLWPEQIELSFFTILSGLACLLLACFLYFLLIICVEALSFWVDNVWALSYALQIGVVFLSGKAIPLEFFPAWSRTLLEASPFPLMVYFPVQAFLGQLTSTELINGMMLCIVWLVVLYMLSRGLIKQGLYQYTGVGQ